MPKATKRCKASRLKNQQSFSIHIEMNDRVVLQAAIGDAYCKTGTR